MASITKSVGQSNSFSSSTTEDHQVENVVNSMASLILSEASTDSCSVDNRSESQRIENDTQSPREQRFSNSGTAPAFKDHSRRAKSRNSYRNYAGRHNRDWRNQNWNSQENYNGQALHNNYGGRHFENRGNAGLNFQGNFNGNPRRYFNGQPHHYYSGQSLGNYYGNFNGHPRVSSTFTRPSLPCYMPRKGPNPFLEYAPPMFNAATTPPEAFGGVPFDYAMPQNNLYVPVPDLLTERIVRQIDYYFSEKNLIKDIFLRKNMDEHGWVSINLISGFPKMRNLTDNIQTDNIQLIRYAVQSSTVVEVQGDNIRRRNDWSRWLMTNVVIEGSSRTTG